jgi:hypothetical protein
VFLLSIEHEKELGDVPTETFLTTIENFHVAKFIEKRSLWNFKSKLFSPKV